VRRPDHGMTRGHRVPCHGLRMTADVRDTIRPTRDPGDRRPGPTAPTLLGVALLVGLAWGAATSGLQTVLPWPVAGLANAVGPWVAPAFLVGALSRRAPVAATAGVFTRLGEVTGYHAVSAARDLGINPTWVAVWAGTGVLAGPVFAAAGWCWRRAADWRWSAAGSALLGGVFLAEGAVGYGGYLGRTGDAVVFCALGAALVLLLGAASPSARAAGASARGAATAAAALVVVLPLGAAGEMGLRGLLG